MVTSFLVYFIILTMSHNYPWNFFVDNYLKPKIRLVLSRKHFESASLGCPKSINQTKNNFQLNS